MAASQDFLGNFAGSLASAADAVSLFAARAVADTIPVSPITAAPGAPYPAMYVFGDSLSDTGNISLVTTGLIPVSPPYEDRSFTNGSVWAQDVAQAIGLPALNPNLAGGTDFAYGGAETGQTPAHTANASDLPSQYQQFLGQVRSPQAGALYAIWIGSNDVLDIANNTSLSTAQQQADVTAAVNNEVSVINELVAHGARSLLVLDVPDLGKTPYEMARGAAAVQAGSSLAALYNSELANDMLSLAASGAVKINLVDTFAVLDHVIANPAGYGFQDVTDPVWNGNLTDSSSGTLAATGAAQNNYLFFDPLHPTAQAHALLASGIATLLTSNTVQAQGPHTEYAIAPDGAGAAIEDSATNTLQVVTGATNITFTDRTAVVDPSGNAGEVARLYQVVLDRAPDVMGLDNWTAQLDSHSLGLNDVALAFINSSEFNAQFGTLDNQDFVERMYEDMRGTMGDPAGVQNWTAFLDSGGSRSQVALDFSDSIENQTNTLGVAGDSNMSEAYRLYGAFGRAPDTGGLDNWTSLLEAGATPLQVAQDFVKSAEFAAIYGGLDATEFVDTLYQNMLHRAADPGGQQTWVGQLDAGASQAQVLLSFSDSLENKLNTSQATHDGWVLLPAAIS